MKGTETEIVVIWHRSVHPEQTQRYCHTLVLGTVLYLIHSAANMRLCPPVVIANLQLLAQAHCLDEFSQEADANFGNILGVSK